MLKMVNDKLELKAKLFRGFGDVTRLAILESVSDGENTVTEIADKLRQSQPNVSNHLSCLLECGLVKSRKDGKNKFYSIGEPLEGVFNGIIFFSNCKHKNSDPS